MTQPSQACFRIGQIVPSSNTTMETEIPAMLRARERMLPERFTFHSSRMRMHRVVKEELGLTAHCEAMVGENEYVASHPEKGKVRKHVYFFLATSDFEPLELKKSGGLDDAKWFRLPDILDLNFYDDMLPIVTAAVQKLLDQARREHLSGVALPGGKS